MKILARNLEILLLEHDLVMIPGLGGFLANYNQAQFENEDDSPMIVPPYRTIVFNKELNSNDGFMVHAYMQNFDATYPQALKQLMVDVQEINDNLNENGTFFLENIGTLHKNIDGIISFEQIHPSLVSPFLFALSPLKLSSVNQLENKLEVQNAIDAMVELPFEKVNERNNGARKAWKDIAISAAAAVVLFFLFTFPNMNNNENEKIVAGNYETNNNTNNTAITSNENISNNKNLVNNNTDNPTQPQIILLAPQQQNQNTVIISQNDLNNARQVNADNGEYTIVISAAANEQCALYVINKLNKDNIPGAYYHSGEDGNFIYYSSFNSANDAFNTINALKKVNKRFKKAWVKKLNNK